MWLPEIAKEESVGREEQNKGQVRTESVTENKSSLAWLLSWPIADSLYMIFD